LPSVSAIPVLPYRGVPSASCTKSGLFGQAQTFVQGEYLDPDTPGPNPPENVEGRDPAGTRQDEKFAVCCREVCGNHWAQISLRKLSGGQE